VQTLLVEVFRSHVNTDVVTEHIDESVTGIGPKESVNNAASLLVTGLSLHLNDRCDAIHRALWSVFVIVIGRPKPVWLPLHGVVQAHLTLAPLAEAKDAELVRFAIADCYVKADGLRSRSYFFIKVEEGLLVPEFLLICQVQGEGPRIQKVFWDRLRLVFELHLTSWFDREKAICVVNDLRVFPVDHMRNLERLKADL
jgi:hypothetical protein